MTRAEGKPKTHVFNDSEGETAVRIARKVITAAVNGENAGEMDIPDSFRDNGGVFTTITRHETGNLRGCIGYSEPILPIISAIIRSSKAAAMSDLRFVPVKQSELDKILISVSLLTKPTRLLFEDPEEIPDLITIGKHGLIVKKGKSAGLLLPQVPVENDWDPVIFLNQTCVKAGIPYKSWRTGKVDILTFTAEVFTETEPNGSIVREELL